MVDHTHLQGSIVSVSMGSSRLSGQQQGSTAISVVSGSAADLPEATLFVQLHCFLVAFFDLQGRLSVLAAPASIHVCMISTVITVGII